MLSKMCFPKIRKDQKQQSTNEPENYEEIEAQLREKEAQLRENFDINKFNSLFNEREFYKQQKARQERERGEKEKERQEKERQKREMRHTSGSHIWRALLISNFF